VPLAIRHRPGQKTIVTPMVGGMTPATTRADPALVKALARAFRYQRMLDEGRYASLTELAAAEKVDRSFLGKLLSLTLLAPDLVQAILEGRCDAGLPSLLRPFPASWHEQASTLAAGSSPASRTDGQASSDKGQSRHEAFG
jgi:hypothetical protein